MIRRKLLIGALSTIGVASVATLVGVGYAINGNSNRYQAYASGPISTSITDLIQSYFSAAVNGSKLLYLASYSHTTPLNKALNISESSNKPIYEYLGKTGYILLDDQYGLPVFSNNVFNEVIDQPIWSTNVAAAQFRSDLGSFITGIAIGQFLNENISYFVGPDQDRELTWATYGGAPYSSVTSFMGGLQQGIQWFNKEIVPKKTGFKKLKQIFLGPETSQNFAMSFDASAGNALITEFLGRNVDALIPIAGPQAIQAVRLVKQMNKKTIIIGVDSAIEEDDTINLPLPNLGSKQDIGNNKVIQFSSVKNLDVISNKITQSINDPDLLTVNANNPEWSDLGGLGYSSVGTVKNNGVGVSKAGQPYFVDAMKIYDPNLNINDSASIDEKYIVAANALGNLKIFNDLNLPENKAYKVEGGGTLSYADIANTGFKMLPITGSKSDIDKWYANQYKNDESMLKNKDGETGNVNLIWKWIEKNRSTIDKRKSAMDNLHGYFTKLNYEKNKSLIKIIYQSPSNILFDHSFLESCYRGLSAYWATQKVKLPDPPNTN